MGAADPRVVVTTLLLPLWFTFGLAKPTAFQTVGEGFTSETAGAGIRVQYRMFSVPAMPQICATSPRPARLVARGTLAPLRIGRLFSLDRLVIVAEDARGRPLAPVPITLEVEGMEPPIFDLRADGSLADSKLLPVAAGRFRFRARTVCSHSTVEVLLPARVREP